MPVTVRCPNPGCAHTTLLPDAAAGRPFRCPACGRTAAPSTDARRTATRASRGGSPAPTMDEPAETVGRFVVRSRLGAGAFGTVYRAFDPQLDREVALKVPNEGTLDTPARVQRFLREAKAAARLRHPHIVPVFDAGRDGERYYIASAFIDGRPLSDTIPDGGCDFRRAARVARELAEALAYAHDEGVIHRDVKSANVMADTADRVHLMDFGLAARRDEESKLTTDGAVMGTPAYMAPEQAAGKASEAGPPADQYAAGVVLYELLTGRVPFEGPTPVVIHNAVHAEPDPPRRHRRGVPKDLETICLKAMAKRPADRYPDCRALADDLRRWLEGEPIAARRLGPAERLLRWARRNKAVAGLSAAVAAVLVLGAAVSSALAVVAAGEANRAEGEAKRAEGEAERADRKAGEAKAQAKLAEDQRDELEVNLYAARILQAQSLWESGQALQVLAMLKQTRPAPGRPDLRGPEWYRLEWLCWASYQVLAHYRNPAGLTRVAYSPDGKRIATAWGHSDAHVFEADGGKTVFELTHPGMTEVTAVTFSDDGRWIATAARADKEQRWEVVLWDARTGARVRAWPAPADDVRFTPKGDRLVFGCWDLVRVCDTATGAELTKIPVEWNGDVRLAVSPDGSRLAVRNRVNRTAVYELGTGRVVFEHEHSQPPGWYTMGVAFYPDGRRLVLPQADGLVQVVDIDRKQVGKLHGTHVRADSVAVSRDGTRIVTAGLDGTVTVWDGVSGDPLASIRGHPWSVKDLALSPDGRNVATAADREIRQWDLTTDPERVRIALPPGACRGGGFTADGTLVVSGHQEVALWDAVTGKKVHTLTSVGHGCVILRVSPDGRAAAGVHEDRRLRGWDLVNRRLLWSVEIPADSVTALAISPDGRWLAGGRPGQLWVRDAADGRVVKEFPAGANNPFCAVAFSPDGRYLAGAVGDGVRIWAAEGWAEHRFLPGLPGNRPTALAWRPRTGQLAVGYDLFNVALWDPDRKEVVARLEYLGTWAVGPLAFSPDGERLASFTFGDGNNVRVWDMKSRAQVWRVDCGDGPSFCWSPDGRRLLVASSRGLTVEGARSPPTNEWWRDD